MRRPQDGIACLEKSIEFFDQTEHALNSVIAYNNLGMNLMLIGEWDKAEEMIKRALAIGLKGDHVHVAGIYDSLGELKILRGDLDEAEQFLEKAVDLPNSENISGTRSSRCEISPGAILPRARSKKPSQRRGKRSIFRTRSATSITRIWPASSWPRAI